MGFLSKKSSSKQQAQSTNQSSNQAYPFLQQQYGGGSKYYNSANEAISDLLGLNGAIGQSEGFQRYKDSNQFQTNLQEGSSAITNNRAASGLLESGSTLKRLNEYGQQVNSNYFGSYMDQLFGLSQSGIGSGQLLAGAGGQSTGQSTSSGSSYTKDGSGIAGAFGSIGAGIAASDRRLKKDIILVGEMENGLNVYDFTYIHTGERITGVMVDEVKTVCPEALGPEVFGYGTVDYGKLNEITERVQ